MDLYLANETATYLDAAISIFDHVFRRSTIIPPGSQGRLTLPDQETWDAAAAFYADRGLTCRTAPVVSMPVVDIGAVPHMPEKKASRK